MDYLIARQLLYSSVNVAVLYKSSLPNLMAKIPIVTYIVSC